MVAYNFTAQFADAVESGKKKQTIRAPRKNGHAKVDGQLQLYTGMRTKQCRKLRDAVCIGVSGVNIGADTLSLEVDHDKYMELSYAEPGCRSEMENFAASDGFDSWESMRDWFDRQHGLPFVGVLIIWE